MGSTKSRVRLGGVFEVTCYDKDGNVKWTDRAENLVVDTGLNYLLDSGFSGSEYVGLKGTGTPAAGDTMSSHATWSEIVPYSDSTRPAYSHAAASSKSLTNSASKASFAINATSTVYGAFLTTNSTKSGTTGTLICAGDFSSSRSVINGDTLEVTYTISAADDGV